MMAYLIIRIEPKENDSRSEKDRLPFLAQFAKAGGFIIGEPIQFPTIQDVAMDNGYVLRLGNDGQDWPFIAYVYTSPNPEGVGRAGGPLRRYLAREATWNGCKRV